MEDFQQEEKTLKTRIRTFLIECRRVWQLTRKPNKTELKTIVKITGIGILIIGLIGFLINLIWQLVLR